ncbi:MAG: hypothetical protein ACREQ7_19045, partial [Candidatus Binatia bacterium]
PDSPYRSDRDIVIQVNLAFEKDADARRRKGSHRSVQKQVREDASPKRQRSRRPVSTDQGQINIVFC